VRLLRFWPATSILLGVEHSCAAVLPPNHAKIKSEYYKNKKRVLCTRGNSANRGTEEQGLPAGLGAEQQGAWEMTSQPGGVLDVINCMSHAMCRPSLPAGYRASYRADS